MLYIPITHLRPGMVLAQDLPSDLFGLSLLTVGQELTVKAISKLEKLGIPGAYVESNFCSDTISEDFIDPKFKHKLLSGIKTQFDNYMTQVVVPNNLFPSVYNISSDLVSFVLSKDEFLLNMIDIRDYDTYTYSHSLMVGMVSVLIGAKLGMQQSDLIDLAMSGLLHDIGKLDIPLNIVNKPGRLTKDEFFQIQQHPSNAVNRLKSNARFPSSVLQGIESHHEKFDGTGYPKQLASNGIPLYGKILALADVYDALTSKRPYRAGWSPGETIEYMMGYSDVHFDHDLLQVFLSVVAAYPVGTFIRLSNGYLAVVIQNQPEMTLRPVIRILDPIKIRGREINLAKDMQFLNVTIVGTISDQTQLPADIFK